MTSNKETVIRYAPLILWMLLIFTISHQPSNSIPQYGTWDLVVKKGGHLFAYGVLALLAARAGLDRKSALALVLLFAVSDELHQRFVPGRNGTVADVIVDLLGGILALLLFRPLARHWPIFRWDRTAAPAEQLPRDA